MRTRVRGPACAGPTGQQTLDPLALATQLPASLARCDISYVVGMSTVANPLVVVVGGANVDVLARSGSTAVAATSNPGTTSIGHGGVARNVAENLARLGTRVELVAAVGRDALGEALLADTAAAGVGVQHVRRTDTPTGTYTAVLDTDGELVVAVADMAATDALGPELVESLSSLLAGAALVVLDGNLPAATIGAAVALSSRVVLDPVSVPKAFRLRPVLAAGNRWFAMTPNLAELGALTGLDVSSSPDGGIDALHEAGVEHVWVRLGPAGSVLSSPSGRITLPVVPAPVADVTGAGDAMLGAFCHGVLTGLSPEEAARFGHGAAALTVASPHSVRPDLSVALVEQALTTRSPT